MMPDYDDIDYTPSPSMHLIIEMLETAANNDGQLHPFHAFLSPEGTDMLDEEWLAIVADPLLLEQGPDDEGVLARL